MKLIGPFTALVTLSEQGDIPNAGVLVDKGVIVEVGPFEKLKTLAAEIVQIPSGCFATPGFIDAHTHLCFSGSRAEEYERRIRGESYASIAKSGGGILSTVRATTSASPEALRASLLERLEILKRNGITTVEIKSGYGLSVDSELDLLQTIHDAADRTLLDVIPTCLAAHVPPPGKSPGGYLIELERELLPALLKGHLAERIDIFVDPLAFSSQEARSYLEAARELGFDLVIHGNQFTTGAVELAVQLGARSIDHLEQLTEEEIRMLAGSETKAVLLPNASLGLGLPFAPARKLFDSGIEPAIASDWNPGSAPMGDLLVGASLLGVYEKLTFHETLKGITLYAAKALGLYDRGELKPDKLADIAVFEGKSPYELFYRQGALKPKQLFKRGKCILSV